MTFSKIGRILSALVATAAIGLGMTACGGGTIGYMYVTGTFYNQISGFKIDDYTGNLTAINHAPFASGGSNPLMTVVKPGGRYIYVINAGTGQVGVPGPNFKTCTGGATTGCFTAPQGAGISQFAVGGDGILTFQQTFTSQGFSPVWAQIDSSGNYLYVLDKYSPYYGTSNFLFNGTDTNGSITAFSIAGDTGKLTLVTNMAVLYPNLPITTTYGYVPGLNTTVFEVGQNPIMTKVGLGGCLLTLSPTSIYPYVQGSNGQLAVTTTGPYSVTGSSRLTSINTGQGSIGSSYVYLTDAGNNQIFSLQSGGAACSFSPISGSQQTNLPGASNPVNSITSQSGKYLYVLNQSQTGTLSTSNSSISAFQINSQGQIQTLADPTSNPYSVGSGPVCIVQDPTNQYLYISNSIDSTITGKLLDQNRGFLSNLSRGSVFPVTKTPTCLSVSGNI